MKISSTAISTLALLVLSNKSSSFTVPYKNNNSPSVKTHRNNIKNSFSTSTTKLHNDNKDDNEAFSELGGSENSDAGKAFAHIINNDMESLQKQLKNGLQPDSRYTLGNTLLHWIALKGREHTLDDNKYLNALKQLWKSGADLQKENDAGHTALDYLKDIKNSVFATRLEKLQAAKLKAPINQDKLDKHLSMLSLQKQPTANAKKWIVNLIKGGANPEFVTSNGKTIFENIKANWDKENVKTFTELVIAAKFKAVSNGKEKTLKNKYVNDKWTESVKSFYNANSNKNEGRGLS